MGNSKEPAHMKDFSKHTTQLREKAVALGHDVQELGKITRDIAQDTVGLLNENASGYYKEGVRRAQQLEHRMEDRIREHPLQSLLIAAGAGLILGALLRRR